MTKNTIGEALEVTSYAEEYEKYINTHSPELIELLKNKATQANKILDGVFYGAVSITKKCKGLRPTDEELFDFFLEIHNYLLNSNGILTLPSSIEIHGGHRSNIALLFFVPLLPYEYMNNTLSLDLGE